MCPTPEPTFHLIGRIPKPFANVIGAGKYVWVLNTLKKRVNHDVGMDNTPNLSDYSLGGECLVMPLLCQEIIIWIQNEYF